MPAVLAVDPEPELLGTVVSSLNDQGYALSSARTVEEALGSLRTTTFDCVLVDEDLEQSADGQLRGELSRYPAGTVAVIVLARGGGQSRLRALQRGAFDCIAKPFEPDLLRLMVARAIERTSLARTLRELLDELEMANAELRASREHLQRRVEEATLDLRAKVDELDRARRQLEDARRQRDEFIHVIAHELSGPLTAVEGYAALLGDQSASSQVARRAAAVIRAEARRMGRLVQDLVHSTEVADELGLELGTCDLVELVEEQVELARALSPGQVILTDVPGSSLETRCDRVRIGQVVFNLLSNAVKYSGGRDIRVRLRGEGETAEVRVIDRGPGIPGDQLEAIFEPRVRLIRANDANTQPSGSGLGLYVARRLAEAHGGSLHAESDGPGATFVLRLPRARPVRLPRWRATRSA
jgi:signal transduction histidine kinase